MNQTFSYPGANAVQLYKNGFVKQNTEIYEEQLGKWIIIFRSIFGKGGIKYKNDGFLSLYKIVSISAYLYKTKNRRLERFVKYD